MTELHWRAATDAGSYDGTALISVGQGAVHLRTDLPAGTLENAVATLSWPMAENEKIFMNGYQTCPSGAASAAQTTFRNFCWTNTPLTATATTILCATANEKA